MTASDFKVRLRGKIQLSGIYNLDFVETDSLFDATKDVLR